MSVSLYQASVPAILKMLNALSGILDKAAAYCEARKIDEKVLLSSRLFPNMLPLSAQFQIVSDNAKGITARLAQAEIPSYPDTETTIAELKARLAKTAEFVKALHPGAFDGAEARTITLTFGGGRKVDFTGQDYLFVHGLPNFYFHATTAYDILRHAGLEIGKRDYLA
jgi:hypothetical protein